MVPSLIFSLLFLIVIVYRTSSSTIAVVLGGCIGEATAPFLVSLAIARFGPEAFVVCIGALIVALVLNYAILHVYLKAIPVVHTQEAEEFDEEGNKGMSRQSSPVLQRRRPPSGHSQQETNLDRHFDAHTEQCYYTTESPRTLMNYTGVSGATKYTAFSEDGHSENENEAGESDASEFASFELPSARYHAVRCVEGFHANHISANTGTSGSHDASATHAHNSPHNFPEEAGSVGKGHLSYSAGSNYGRNNNNNDAGLSLYARSFRQQVPMLRHPLNNKQYEQLLQEEEEENV